MERHKWFRSDWPESIRTLAAKIKANSYSEQKVDGFIIDRVRDGEIQARFIERFSYQETVTDPFGTDILIDRLEYRQCRFAAYSRFPHLELIGAPKSVHTFISRLAEINHFGISISPLTVDILDWIKRYQRLSDAKVFIASIQISHLQLDDGVTGSVTLRGDADVRKALSSITSGRKFVLDKVQVKWKGGERRSAVLTSNGSVSLDMPDPASTASSLREALAGMAT